MWCRFHKRIFGHLLLLVILVLGLLGLSYALFVTEDYADSVSLGGYVGNRSHVVRSGVPWLPVDTSPPGQRSIFHDPVIPPPPPVPAIKVVVEQDGLYVLEYEDVAGVPGWDPNADPRTFHLLRRGQSIPIWVEGASDGRFDPGDRILFYGQKRRGSAMLTKYSDAEVYWLTWGNTPGLRVQVRDAFPVSGLPNVTTARHTIRFEEDVHWFTHHGLDFPTRNTWWWARLRPRERPLTYTFALTLPAALPQSTASIAYDLAPRTRAGVHRVRLSVGGMPVDERTFSGHTYVNFTTTWSLHLDGDDVLNVDLSVDPLPELGMEDLYLNGFTVTYTRFLTAVNGMLDVYLNLERASNVHVGGFSGPDVQVWDVTSITAPVRLLGTVALTLSLAMESGLHHLVVADGSTLLRPRVFPYVPRDYRRVVQGADVIIIAHREVWGAAARLAEYRRLQGYRVALVDVDALYDEFGWGWYHPEAIRAFLAYAYMYWPRPAPRYVLLFGDGHWNFKGVNTERYGPLPPNLIPPYLAWVDPFQGEVPVDLAYGLIQGNDDIPDMIVGRIPVHTAAEAEAVVDKIITYETGAWKQAASSRVILLVADDPDMAGNFPFLLDRLSEAERPVWATPARVYLKQTVPDASAARVALREALNQGAFLVLYQGHGAIHRWTRESIFTVRDIPSLANHEVWPIVATFNCLDGYFAYPRLTDEAIAELMLRQEGVGSIAAFSPAGLSTPSIQIALAQAFLSELFRARHQVLGDVIHRARLRVYHQEGPVEIFFTQALFGDPLLHLSWPVTTFFPAVEVDSRR